MNYNIETIKNMFDKMGYDLITDYYINNKQTLEYICREHSSKGIQTTTLNDFLRKDSIMCVYCRYEKGLPNGKPWPDDIIRDALDKLNCDFIGRYSNEKGYSVIQFICRKHPWKGVQETNWTQVRTGQQICGICNGTKRTTEDFKRIMYEINPNIEILGEYKGARKQIHCRCRIDGHEWDPLVYNLISGYGCPECANKASGQARRTSQEYKIKTLKEKHSDIEFLSIPTLSTDYVKCRCKLCGYEWEATYSNLTHYTRATGCPKCSISESEKLIMKILDEWKIKYIYQYKFEDLKDKQYLPFDFYLPDSNVLIEFDGEHHFYPIQRSSDDLSGEIAQEDFEITVRHDNMKTDYCYQNNIPLIRIPYFVRDRIKYFLFDEFVDKGVLIEI